MLEAVILLATAVAGFLLIDLARNRHPLTPQEVHSLAQKRRRTSALTHFRFDSSPRTAAPWIKQAMKKSGEFKDCDIQYYEGPSKISGLLKYKKHEWIIIAFMSELRIFRLWWNKGPDGTMVWSLLEDHHFDQIISVFKPDTIAIFHNHPNPNPARFRCDLPSEADLKSAREYSRRFREKNISLLEFICERGIPHLFYASFSDGFFPVRGFIDGINTTNGKGIFKNYALRREMRQRSIYDGIAE